jgi:DNA mismatch repair protein MutS2
MTARVPDAIAVAPRAASAFPGRYAEPALTAHHETHLDPRSLELLELPQVRDSIALQAASTAGRARLARWSPFRERDQRARETACLADAIRRSREPGAWCEVGRGELAALVEQGARAALDGPALVEILSWLDAAVSTAAAWNDMPVGERHPALAARVRELVIPGGLRNRLAAALDADGRLRDAATPLLGRVRGERAAGERALEHQLERWARGFGADAYVTRHAERFVAMVPAAGFVRRRGIVHDQSGSGQSLLVEPFEACEANNRLIEQHAQELEEERRILRELAAEVAAAAPELKLLEDVLVHLDTLRARALWANDLGAIALDPAGIELRLREARHPLLALRARRDGGEVVPLDLDLGGSEGEPSGGEDAGGSSTDARLLLVSGPNMGGKTVLLKTVGLAVACAHAGLPVLAREGSRIPELDDALVDLGDEQSIEQGLSTFAGHLRVLARMAREAGPRTLVLADELGAGTDPEEGAALARALLEHLAAVGAWGVVTTHLGSLKRLAAEVSGLVNGSLEFDTATLTPRHRFLPGVPGSSHALSVAERLGFPQPLLRRAHALTPDSTLALERLTSELAETTRRAAAAATAHEAARREAQAAAESHRQATETARREAGELRQRLGREAQALLARARELWQTVQREARRSDKTRAGAERLRVEMQGIERDVESLAGPVEAPAAAGQVAPETLTPGMRVRVADLGVDAEVAAAPDPDGRVQLRRGSWNIQSHVSRLAPATSGTAPAEGPVRAAWALPEEAAARELDLRGMEVAEALAALDGGLDRAMLAGLGEIRVVHGVGRGVLRAAVEKHLRQHPQVSEQRLGLVGEGGRGVTVVRLR